MTDWRSEPPDAEGWRQCQPGKPMRGVRWYVVSRHGTWVRRIDGNYFPPPHGGQWRRAPE